MSEKVEIGVEEATSYLEAQVNQARYDLKENLLPVLNHGQKTRLIMAIADYPNNDADFSEEQVEMIKAFSALKVCNDAQVALGVQMVIEEMRLNYGQEVSADGTALTMDIINEAVKQQETKDVNNV